MKKSAKRAATHAPATRRQTERLAIELPITIKVTRKGGALKEQTRTLDLSRGGASFMAGQSYREGMDLRVGFVDLQHLSAEMQEIPAQVVRVIKLGRWNGTTVAVRFVNLELANLVFSELLRVKIRSSSALLGILQALSSGAALSTVIEEICRTSERAMDAEKVLLFLNDPEQKALRAPTGADGGAGGIQIKWGEGLVGKVARSGKLANVPSLASDRRFRPELEKYFDERTRNVLCIPLNEENGVSPGVLVILNKRFSPFTREDEGLGAAVASQISLVLREVRLFEHIRNMKDYFERILESIATGILTFDGLGKLNTINRAGREIFGFSLNRDVGRDSQTLFEGKANARLASLTKDILTEQKGGTAYDVRFLRGDGISMSLNLNALPLLDKRNNTLGGVLVAEDITQEQRLMNTLCRYMAREVAEHVLQNNEELKLGGTRMEVSILLTDIRNFTAISEQMDPSDIVDLLNTYFPRIINVVFRHRGMVDKFIGDSILAVFGVPACGEDDALRAVRAAIDMRKEIAAINKERALKGQRTIEIGIGITSGTVISGNIGSERRMDYTVIGDPVNLAARLEGLTKEVKRMILVDERVQGLIAKEINCEALGLFAIKGKREKVQVFAVRTA